MRNEEAMKKFVVLCEEEDFPLDKAQAIEQAMSDFVDTDVTLSVEFVFVDGEEIQRLNRETRNMDKVTDVLSYPSLEGIKGKPIRAEAHPYEIDDEDGSLMLGSIVVCCERAKEQAEEYGHSYERELHYLLVHGIMHCLGYDHETDEERAEMREKEEFVLRKLGITRE